MLNSPLVVILGENMKIQQIKICRYCKKQYLKKVNVSKDDWKKSKFCSTECGQKGKNNSHLKKYYIKRGQHLGKESQFKKGQTKGEKNVNWKGDKASYYAKHIWAKNNFVKTGICEICGLRKTIKNSKYGTHWSNTSGTYLRDRRDWRELCVSCHKKQDLQRL